MVLTLSIAQKPQDGLLGSSESKRLPLQYKEQRYEITINQCGERRITVTSSEYNYPKGFLEVYYRLETLLMLLDGQFYPVISAFENEVGVTYSFQERTLASYHSADFMVGTGNKLIDYCEVLDEDLFLAWNDLRDELDLTHSMVLYSLSSAQVPAEMKCAFMTEAFLGLCELVNKKRSDFALPEVQGGQSKLKLYLRVLIKHYGSEIFKEESLRNEPRFAQILVDNRNRIAHIKSKQSREYLNGDESVMCLMKLSLLYRVILFDLLGLTNSFFESKLASRIQAVNEHASMRDFLEKLDKCS